MAVHGSHGEACSGRWDKRHEDKRGLVPGRWQVQRRSEAARRSVMEGEGLVREGSFIPEVWGGRSALNRTFGERRGRHRSISRIPRVLNEDRDMPQRSLAVARRGWEQTSARRLRPPAPRPGQGLMARLEFWSRFALRVGAEMPE